MHIVRWKECNLPDNAPPGMRRLMCRRTEADLCCEFPYFYETFYVIVKIITLFGCFVCNRLHCEGERRAGECVHVCVIVLLLDLERLWSVVGSLITRPEEFIHCSEWTFLCVVAWLTVQICNPPPCVFALFRTLCQFALELGCLPWYVKPGGGVCTWLWLISGFKDRYRTSIDILQIKFWPLWCQKHHKNSVLSSQSLR